MHNASICIFYNYSIIFAFHILFLQEDNLNAGLCSEQRRNLNEPLSLRFQELYSDDTWGQVQQITFMCCIILAAVHFWLFVDLNLKTKL